MTKSMISASLLILLSAVTEALYIEQKGFLCKSFSPLTSHTPKVSEMDVPSSILEVQVVDKMPERLPTDLKNKYFMLRHGQSTANVASVISSSRSLAYSDKHGVTSLGYEQGVNSAEQLIEKLKSSDGSISNTIVFVSSPFARARQTAQACIDGLAKEEQKKQLDELGLHVSENIVLNERLMERYFGRLDDEAIYTYAYVWPLDKMDVTHTAFDVESVAAVCTRLRELVLELEKEYENCNIVWVSHADVLQIGQLYAAGASNVGEFSSYRFKNGEVREIQRNTDSLPEPFPLEAPKRGTFLYDEMKSSDE